MLDFRQQIFLKMLDIHIKEMQDGMGYRPMEGNDIRTGIIELAWSSTDHAMKIGGYEI